MLRFSAVGYCFFSNPQKKQFPGSLNLFRRQGFNNRINHRMRRMAIRLIIMIGMMGVLSAAAGYKRQRWSPLRLSPIRAGKLMTA